MRPPSLEAVIFDMDGLILDTEPIYRRAWKTAGDDLGFPIDDAFYETLVGRREQEAMEAMREKFGGSFPEDRFQDRWLGVWKTIVKEKGIPVKKGFKALYRLLHDANVPVAIATSTEDERARVSLAASGLTGWFSIVVTGDEIANGKPAPDIYLEAAHRLNVSPASCLVLEDSEPGILSADAAGMTAIMVPDMVEPSEDVRSAAYRVVPSLVEAQDLIVRLGIGLPAEDSHDRADA